MSVQWLIDKGETLDQTRADFLSFVDKRAAGCWVWTGTGTGYGYYRGMGAHRASWELFRGPIPNGKHVMHRCDVLGAEKYPNPLCVNPEHLQPGTARENAFDAARARKLRRAEEAQMTKPTTRITIDDLVRDDPEADRAALNEIYDIVGTCQLGDLDESDAIFEIVAILRAHGFKVPER
jgi:hypothetical protein